jgi:glycine cleavage system H protein
MSEVPEGLHYTKEHEWIRIDGDEFVLGITDHAQHALTDIVYVELPEVGQSCVVMDEIAIVESVKSASPIFAPLVGDVVAINEALEDTPELINQDPYGEGWMVKMSIADSTNLPSLLDAAQYKAEIGE